VFVHRVVNKTTEAVFYCSLDSTSSRRSLQVPQWMFDSAALCGVRLTPTPAVDARDLQALRELLSTAIDGDVIQGQHPSVDDAGENDAKIIDAAVGAAEGLSSCTTISDLEQPAAGDSSTSACASRSTVAGSGHSGSRRRRRRRA
jgi:hypothetical protein